MEVTLKLVPGSLSDASLREERLGANRFLFLSSLESGDDAPPSHAAKYWDIERIVGVDAPTGMEGSAYTPAVQHYVFLIRRKNT